ncbi:MAG TPA: DMT family transporter [Stellaceae bacterium]|nr:DMT family transporter [Stellaceae bacterium]
MPFVLLVALWLCWGASYPVTAIALRGFDVVTCRVLVQALGAGALLVQAVLCRHRFRIGRAAWPDLAVVAILYMTIMPLCMNLGVYLAGPGRTAILVYTMPIWASLFARLLLGEALTANRIAALVLGAGAVLALVSQDFSHLAHAPAGAACALVAATTYGLGTVWLKRRDWHADPSVVAFWQLVVGTVPILLLWAALRLPTDLAKVGAAQWLSVAFLGIAGNGAAYFAWYRLVGRLPATISGISVLAIPCIGLASSAWFLGEAIHPQDLAAMAMIGAALVLVLAEQARTRERTPTPAPARERR